MDVEERELSPEEENESSDDDTSGSEKELMVTTRARRITAGNRYSTLIAQEEAEQDEEDEVAMLFAEGEGEDDDFNSDEGDEDADMSSSDDDDQGPNTAVDDMEGEQDVLKEAKAERARKRKADLALTTTASLKKKPKLDPTALRRAPVPKPSKRKERVSWLPGADAAPGRTSLRKQTILHRAETHAKLKENEAQRLKMKAKREKRVREREAEAPKQMTQADRLAEAERIERRNAKSLNRWEAMERKRAEEQAARLAALKERKLEGAVVTLYSTSAKYYGLKEVKEIELTVPVQGKKRGRKPKALLEQLAAAKLASGGASAVGQASNQTEGGEAIGKTDVTSPVASVVSLPHAEPIVPQPTENIATNVTEQPAGLQNDSQAGLEPGTTQETSESFLTGIHEFASMQSDSKTRTEFDKSSSEVNAVSGDGSKVIEPQSTSSITKTHNVQVADVQQGPENVDAPPDHEQRSVDIEMTETIQLSDKSASEQRPAENLLVESSPVEGTTKVNDVLMSEAHDSRPEKAEIDVIVPKVSQQVNEDSKEVATANVSTQTQAQPELSTMLENGAGSPTPPTSGEPPIEVISTRNVIILDRFDDLSGQARHDFSLFYNSRKTSKLVKHNQELCPITGLTARYRDPATGMGYANAMAYKKLQELKNHQFTWSSMLGCYVGRNKIAARGVPEGFLGT